MIPGAYHLFISVSGGPPIVGHAEFADGVFGVQLAPAVRSFAGCPRKRPVALPIEHGGWAFLFEPIVLGLLLAPSLAGSLVAVSAIALFLARHPFKLAAGDFRKRRALPRTRLAMKFGLAYASAAGLCLILALIAGGSGFLIPMLIAVPFTAIQFFYDVHSRSRELFAELAAAVATGATAVAIAFAGGWESWPAFALWAVLVARSVPSILYVRARLRLMRGQEARISTVLVMHVAGLAVVIALARFDFVSLLVVAAFLVLAVRATVGLFDRRQVAAKSIGLQEIIYGAGTVFSVVIGRAIGW